MSGVPKRYPIEFRRDVVAVARRGEDCVTLVTLLRRISPADRRQVTR